MSDYPKRCRIVISLPAAKAGMIHRRIMPARFRLFSYPSSAA